MAAAITLKLTNRSPKQPIKKLPSSLDVPPTATVEDVKILIARETGTKDYHRFGIYDPSTKKTIKDRRAHVAAVPGVAAAGEVLVKDMGPQIAWRTVFLLEYFGPLFFHTLIVLLRPYIYSNAPASMSKAQRLCYMMVAGHFLKRMYETVYVHKFSAATMPVFNIFKNCAYYWFPGGLFAAYFTYKPTSLAATVDIPALRAIALLLYLFGEIVNYRIHVYLSTLRSPGGTERKIPAGYGFDIVTCPNYTVELLAWLGIILASLSWSITGFISIGTVQMFFWSQAKERAYRKEFGDKYKKKRYLMFPGLV